MTSEVEGWRKRAELAEARLETLEGLTRAELVAREEDKRLALVVVLKSAVDNMRRFPEGLTGSGLRAVDVAHWIEECERVLALAALKELPTYTAHLVALRMRTSEELDIAYAALESIAVQCACKCGESWTSRGLHSPDCLQRLAVEAMEPLARACAREPLWHSGLTEPLAAEG